MNVINIDDTYLKETLLSLLNIPSPSGYSDQIVHFTGERLEEIGLEFSVTRRGAICATCPGKQKTLDRAIAVHLDTLGAMVTNLKPNGRLSIAPIGHWSSRFAEGARVTIYCDQGPRRGTVLPLKSSGHVYGPEIDTQPVSWDNLEVRVDTRCRHHGDLVVAGYNVGDFVVFDAVPEITSNGYINARHLDDKAGVAVLLTAAKAVADNRVSLPLDCHLLFTIFEEVGSGASSVLYGDVAEMVTIDHAPVAPGQNSSEAGVVIGMMDQTGPFDYHLSRKLLQLCKKFSIEHSRDIFKYYRTDSASAIEAGNDTRTALCCFGVDGSHGYERTHISSLLELTKLTTLYMQSTPTFLRDKNDRAPLQGFPHQPNRDLIQIET